jgi:hypothetical protein
MSKVSFDSNGEVRKKPIPASKRPCPYSCVNRETGRRSGVCHEGRIVSILNKMEEDETIVDLMNRKSKIVVELECKCPIFGECKLWAKCESRIRVIKDIDGEIVDKIPFPVKTIKTTELGLLTPLEFDSLKSKRKKSFKKKINGVKNPDYVGNATKKSKMVGRKKQRSVKFMGEKLLIN